MPDIHCLRRCTDPLLCGAALYIRRSTHIDIQVLTPEGLKVGNSTIQVDDRVLNKFPVVLGWKVGCEGVKCGI